MMQMVCIDAVRYNLCAAVSALAVGLVKPMIGDFGPHYRYQGEKLWQRTLCEGIVTGGASWLNLCHLTFARDPLTLRQTY